MSRSAEHLTNHSRNELPPLRRAATIFLIPLATITIAHQTGIQQEIAFIKSDTSNISEGEDAKTDQRVKTRLRLPRSNPRL